MLTMGFIGNGKSVNRYHLPFVLNKDNIKVKTIYAPSKGVWKKIEGVKYTQNIDDVLNDPEIQLVTVSVPANLHYSLAKEALEAGKNVLLEKPFVSTSKEAKELFALAKSKHLFLQCYQNRRFDSDFLTLQKVIKSGVLGDILEVESTYDYYRPYVPENVKEFSIGTSYLYGHGCHTIDQILSFFGNPDSIHYDVRQLLGKNRMNDYFDLDMYYGVMKVSVKSSYFRIKPRPSFVVYGKKGMFIKQDMDHQEIDLKHFYMPDNDDFGIDDPKDYGTLTYYDDDNNYHEEKVVSEIGDYSRVYQGVYDSIINGADKIVKDEETIKQIEILEEGIRQMK
ncbi:Gfo/Idh/MocA family oxidoreductase [Companilactobacillus allii]|uniref:NAD(P)-dependent oxidoreductase n=1 Tax=Companilactobacillus allii TaxID=1847728 RepID=A0A1P8Q542_9LACO|nr:Gfo/Idh/MocA family oxidoreductase [Companilactobacillus allii]APX72963.1 NAD(P)-dependent oxidoreductase [Companilactobacillus allii]USQ67755.1 Gfo/Idh/MocA family oxidoreductase [Companilactobacillus allii]